MPPEPVLRRLGEVKGHTWRGWTVDCEGQHVEDLCAYTELIDHLCPVHIKDVLSGPDIHSDREWSFEILHKLGSGGFATAWLARERYGQCH